MLCFLLCYEGGYHTNCSISGSDCRVQIRWVLLKGSSVGVVLGEMLCDSELQMGGCKSLSAVPFRIANAAPVVCRWQRGTAYAWCTRASCATPTR